MPSQSHQSSPSMMSPPIDPYGFRVSGSDEQRRRLWEAHASCQRAWRVAFPLGASVPPQSSPQKQQQQQQKSSTKSSRRNGWTLPSTASWRELLLFVAHTGIADRHRSQLWMTLSGALALRRAAPSNHYAELVRHAEAATAMGKATKANVNLCSRVNASDSVRKRRTSATATPQPSDAAEPSATSPAVPFHTQQQIELVRLKSCS